MLAEVWCISNGLLAIGICEFDYHQSVTNPEKEETHFLGLLLLELGKKLEIWVWNFVDFFGLGIFLMSRLASVGKYQTLIC